jgi:hypothetical protein
MSMFNDEDRIKFLLQMHNSYWNNISRAEDACWKMMAAYTALIAGLSLSVPVIGYIGFLEIFIPFSFMSIAIFLNANLWFLRNIGLISNLEKEFLRNVDYNYLIPKRWSKKYSFLNSEPWWVFISAYFFVCLLITLLMFQKIDCTEKISIGFLFLICLSLIILYGKKMRDRYERFKIEAPGKSLE